jgi:Tol biopolymer transport system component
MNQYSRATLCGLAFLWLLTACSIDISPSTQTSSTNVSLKWSSLHLTGKLVYTAGEREGTNIVIAIRTLDLSTGNVSTIFKTAPPAWLDAAAVSPDGKQIAIAYVPPNGSETIFLLPADGSGSPQRLVVPEQSDESNTLGVWSPDGRYLYFVHTSNQTGGHPEIQRMAYPGGNPEPVVENATWPRLSPDSRQLVYIHIDPQTGVNRLYVASADGSGQRWVVLSGGFIPAVIDAPMFSPDMKSILFSAPDPALSSAWKWLDTALSIELIHPADGSVPSDWWSVPVAGGVKQQLTHIPWLSLYGSYSPDNRHIATYTASGVFVMNPDGTGVTAIVPDTGGIPGTVQWIP